MAVGEDIGDVMTGELPVSSCGLGSSDARSESISMMARTLFILRLRSRLWLYLIKREDGSAACSGSHGGDKAFCLAKRLLQR
jgi:hypothetical protein